MTLHQLKIFIAVAKYLNFRKAAEELHISQPSVFVQFKNLEQEYKLQLYTKKGRAIELTHNGELFFRYAKTLLSQVAEFEQRFKDNGKTRKLPILRIGGSYGPSTSFLPRLLAAFRADHPNIHVSLRTRNSRTIEEMVLNSDIDLGVVVQPPSSLLIQYEQCQTERIVAFASPKYFKSKCLTLAQLAMTPLVFSTDGAPHEELDSIPNIFRRHKLTPNVVMHCDSPEAAKASVKMGTGVGILNREVLEPELGRGDLKTIKVPGLDETSHSFIIYHKNSSLSAQGVVFLNMLRKANNSALESNIPAANATLLDKVPERY
jgi:DNA-binding transcriptional LysR family regulator